MNKLIKSIIVITSAIVVLTLGTIVASRFLLPYELTANGETIVVVKNEDVGNKVVKKLIAEYVPDDSEFKSVTVDKDLKLRQMRLRDVFSRKEVLSGTEAVNYLATANENEAALFNTTIESEVIEEETYTPEVEYKEDKNMFAGESRIETEGSDGVKNVTYQLTSVNGEVENKKSVSEKIVKEGESKVICKGTLGLPEGADWKTYEGLPVYNDGEDVVKSAVNHFGAPYKYGGSSFEKGIDCVQYVRKIYKMYGISVPNGHGAIQKFGKGVSLKDAQPGDIICYKKHVAIYAGDGMMAEATRKKGTHMSKVRDGYVTIRRVTKR